MSKIEAITDSVALKFAARVTQLIGIPIGLATLGWVATSLIAVRGQIIQLQTQMQERTIDRYTGADAAKDKAYFIVRLDSIETYVARNAERIDGLEKRERERIR